jgi:hypothetical protein
MGDQIASILESGATITKPHEPRIIKHTEALQRSVASYNEFRRMVTSSSTGQAVIMETKFVPIKKGDGKKTVVTEMQFEDALSGRNIVYVQRYKRDGKPVCVDDLDEEERANFEDSCLLTALHHGSDIYRAKVGVAAINIDNIHYKESDAFREEGERQEKKVQLISRGAKTLIEIPPNEQTSNEEGSINQIRGELQSLKPPST